MSIKSIRHKWKSEMTDRERLNNQLHYKPVDRCFNMEFGYWDENFSLWPLFYENGIRNNEEADIFFNFDKLVTIGGNYWMHPSFDGKVLEVTATKKIIMNGDGLIAEIPKDGHDTIPHFLKPSIVTPDDWKKCKEQRFRRDDPAREPNIEALKVLYPASRDFPVCINCGSMIGKIRDMLTFEGLAYACYDYPDMVEDMVETCCLLVEDYIDKVLPHIQFDLASGWEDICFKNGPIVSVDFFRDIVMPRYKRIKKKLMNFDVDIWYTDCDGDVSAILPYFLEGGINCMLPFEVNGGGHPSILLNKYGKDLRIMGGVDKMQLGNGREATKTYLESLVPLVERGGYIPFCDHRCPPNVKPDDYLYYLDLKEEIFGMK